MLDERVKMEGFGVAGYADRSAEALERLGTWIGQGKLKYREDIVFGFENTRRAVRYAFSRRRGQRYMRSAGSDVSTIQSSSRSRSSSSGPSYAGSVARLRISCGSFSRL